MTGGSGTDVCRLLHIQTQFRHATLKQHKLPIEHALLTALVARLADDQGMTATVGLDAEMRGMRQQEIARSLDTLQQRARTLLDTAAGTAGDESENDGDDTGSQQRAVMPEPELVGAPSVTPGD